MIQDVFEKGVDDTFLQYKIKSYFEIVNENSNKKLMVADPLMWELLIAIYLNCNGLWLNNFYKVYCKDP